MLQCPPHPGADGFVVVRVGEHPLRGALEDGQPADCVGDRRRDLEAAGAGADHHHVLTGEVCGVIPAGGVEGRAGKTVGARDVGDVGGVELPDGTDHRAGAQGFVVAVGIPHGDRPRVVLPYRGDHFGAEPDALLHTVAVHDVGEVGLQFRLAGEVLRPVIRRLEAVAVEVIAHVYPGAGIAVLPPGSAHTGVLLDHGVGDPGLLQPDCGQQAGLAAADHDDREVGACRRAGLQVVIAGVVAVEFHFLEHHRYVLVGHLGDGDPIHHLLEHHRVDRFGLGAAAFPVIADDAQGQCAGLVFVLLGHIALHLIEEQPQRPEWTLDDGPAHRVVIGHVHTRHQQCRDRHVPQCRGDLFVGVGERHAGVRVAHRLRLRAARGRRHPLLCPPPSDKFRREFPRGPPKAGCRSEAGATTYCLTRLATRGCTKGVAGLM